MTIMKTQDLTVKIQHKEILTKINLSFAAGRTTAIIGPNGSGKSTLLKALTTILQDRFYLKTEILKNLVKKSWHVIWQSCHRIRLYQLI